jgi:valyl-tRNA synthetase
MSTYKLIWGDFCSWYLEMIKPDYQKPIDAATKEATIKFFEKILKLLHPFMPFISEELWHELGERAADDCLIVGEWPKANSYDEKILKEAELAFEVIGNVRNTRNAKQIAQKEPLALMVKTADFSQFNTFSHVIQKLGNLSSFETTNDKIENSVSFVLTGDEFFIPLVGNVDLVKEKEEIVKELAYTKGFLKSIEKKLSNERFVSGAPEQVVAMEKKKMEDAQAKIKVLEESLVSMG